MSNASIQALKAAAMTSSNREPAFASHIDLVTDVFSGKLTQSEANEIADKRILLGCGMDSDFARQSAYETKTRRAIGQNIATKGMGASLAWCEEPRQIDGMRSGQRSWSL